MRRDEINAGMGTALGVEVATTRQTIAQVTQLPCLPLPETPDRVSILVVPFRPGPWEVPDLIALWSDIPGLGNEFDLRQHRVLEQDLQERTLALKALHPRAETPDQSEPVRASVTQYADYHDGLQHAGWSVLKVLPQPE
jgi:hypothetical protein